MRSAAPVTLVLMVIAIVVACGDGAGVDPAPAARPGPVRPGAVAASPMDAWLDYELHWRERPDELTQKTREEAADIETQMAEHADVDRLVSRWVGGQVREQLADEFLQSAFGQSGVGAVALAAEASVSQNDLTELRSEHGAYGGSGTPRSFDGPAVRAGRVRASMEFPGWFEKGTRRVDMGLLWSREEGWRIETLEIAPHEQRPDDPFPSGGPLVPVPDGQEPGARLERQTCVGCDAVRFGITGDAWGFAVARPALDGCTHMWRSGASKGVHPSVRDGRVVLVRNAAHVGAFILRAQTTDPDSMSYDWVTRPAAGSSFDPSDEAVESGSEDRVSVIDFAAFRVTWSGAGRGAGWIYYQHGVGAEVEPGATRICLTDATSFADVDPVDERWIYRASLSDEGVRGK